ncbi:MAG: hypothetical protein ABT05_05545, partial [Lautropia sp. SCN 66-9]
MTRPLICLTLGDMNGIGPEVGLRAVEALGDDASIVVVGDKLVVEQAASLVGCRRDLHAFDPASGKAPPPGRLSFIDTGTGAGRSHTPGRSTREAGIDTVVAQDIAFALARKGQVQASVMGPVNADSIALSGMRKTAMDPSLGSFYLFLVSGTLRIAHLTDHMPLVEVCTREVKQARVALLLTTLHRCLSAWGMPHPRIAVAGLNPHCRGAEDRDEIAPAVSQARAAGIDAVGPISPDSVFRECIDGRFDAVAA